MATSWELVTGDAESTDTSESITWTSDQNLSLLPNTPNSPDRAMPATAPGLRPAAYNPNYLTGVGTTTVKCSATASEDHTGTAMLQATTPSSLTVTLNADGTAGDVPRGVAAMRRRLPDLEVLSVRPLHLGTAVARRPATPWSRS